MNGTNSTPPTVLIVEDEADLADLYAIWLGETNAVTVAYDYETAVDLLDDTLDVALLDRHLPDGSGDDLLEDIRDQELDCRVAMVTAVAPEPEDTAMDFDAYLQKPVSSDDLRDVVDRLHSQGATHADQDASDPQSAEQTREASTDASLDTGSSAGDPQPSEGVR